MFTELLSPSTCPAPYLAQLNKCLTGNSRKDLATIFDIRDNAFHLLVQKLGEQTPLIYASRRSPARVQPSFYESTVSDVLYRSREEPS